MSQAIDIACFLGLISASWLIRTRPFRLNQSLGVDNWYWLLCAEYVKRRRRMPVQLPYYMLEKDEQSYPPLYALFLALWPTSLLTVHGGRLSQAIDILQGLLIFAVVLYVTGSVGLACAGGVSYAFATLPLHVNTQLQPRGLANLALTCAVGGAWSFSQTGSPAVWMATLALSVAILFLHKMTAQMWAVYVLGFGICAQSWMICGLLPGAVATATLISGGFYVKMLRGHWEIVCFWHRNIRHLGSHQYYESRRYEKSGFQPTAIHRPGLRALAAKLLDLLANPFVLALPVMLAAEFSPSGPAPSADEPGALSSFLWCWLGLTYLWALLTMFVPYLTALGAGSLYQYHGFMPLFLLAATLFEGMSHDLRIWLCLLWSAALVISGFRYRTYLNSLKNSKMGVVNQGLYDVLAHLTQLPGDGVFCIPFAHSDVTAYWTRKKVFFGGHTHGFKTALQPYFPVMREDVVATLATKGISYVLYWNGYLDSLRDIGIIEGQHVRQIHQSGDYELYEVLVGGSDESIAVDTVESEVAET